jgi:hypothetical protein
MEMKNIINLIFLGFLGYKVWDQVKGDVSKLQEWDYEITNFYINKLTGSQIQGTIVWNFINKSSQAGGIKDVQVDVLYQDRVIGSVFAPGPFQVPGNGSAEIRTGLNLDLGAVGAKAMKMLQDLAVGKDIPLFLQGTARVRAGSGFYVKLPIQIQTTAKTIISYFN